MPALKLPNLSALGLALQSTSAFGRGASPQGEASSDPITLDVGPLVDPLDHPYSAITGPGSVGELAQRLSEFSRLQQAFSRAQGALDGKVPVGEATRHLQASVDTLRGSPSDWAVDPIKTAQDASNVLFQNYRNQGDLRRGIQGVHRSYNQTIAALEEAKKRTTDPQTIQGINQLLLQARRNKDQTQTLFDRGGSGYLLSGDELQKVSKGLLQFQKNYETVFSQDAKRQAQAIREVQQEQAAAVRNGKAQADQLLRQLGKLSTSNLPEAQRKAVETVRGRAKEYSQLSQKLYNELSRGQPLSAAQIEKLNAAGNAALGAGLNDYLGGKTLREQVNGSLALQNVEIPKFNVQVQNSQRLDPLIEAARAVVANPFAEEGLKRVAEQLIWRNEGWERLLREKRSYLNSGRAVPAELEARVAKAQADTYYFATESKFGGQTVADALTLSTSRKRGDQVAQYAQDVYDIAQRSRQAVLDYRNSNGGRAPAYASPEYLEALDRLLTDSASLRQLAAKGGAGNRNPSDLITKVQQSIERLNAMAAGTYRGFDAKLKPRDQLPPFDIAKPGDITFKTAALGILDGRFAAARMPGVATGNSNVPRYSLPSGGQAPAYASREYLESLEGIFSETARLRQLTADSGDVNQNSSFFTGTLRQASVRFNEWTGSSFINWGDDVESQLASWRFNEMASGNELPSFAQLGRGGRGFSFDSADRINSQFFLSAPLSSLTIAGRNGTSLFRSAPRMAIDEQAAPAPEPLGVTEYLTGPTYSPVGRSLPALLFGAVISALPQDTLLARVGTALVGVVNAIDTFHNISVARSVLAGQEAIDIAGQTIELRQAYAPSRIEEAQRIVRAAPFAVVGSVAGILSSLPGVPGRVFSTISQVGQVVGAFASGQVGVGLGLGIGVVGSLIGGPTGHIVSTVGGVVQEVARTFQAISSIKLDLASNSISAAAAAAQIGATVASGILSVGAIAANFFIKNPATAAFANFGFAVASAVVLSNPITAVVGLVVLAVTLLFNWDAFFGDKRITTTQTADFDGDGQLDDEALRDKDNDVTVTINSKGGESGDLVWPTVELPGQFANASLAYMDRYVDMNMDGKADLVLFDEEGDFVRIYLTNPSATGFITPEAGAHSIGLPDPDGDYDYKDYRLIDFNLDSRPDIVRASPGANAGNTTAQLLSPRWFKLGAGDATQNMRDQVAGTLVGEADLALQGLGGVLSYLFAYGYDLNGDTYLDTLFQDPASDKLYAYLQNKDGTALQVVSDWKGPVRDLYGYAVSTDTNVDGSFDSLYVAADGGVWLSIGGQNNLPGPFRVASTPEAIKVALTPSSAPEEYRSQRPELLDINHDGRVDLVWGKRYIQISLAPTLDQASNGVEYFGDLIDTQVDWTNMAAGSAAANVLNLLAEGGPNDASRRQDGNGDFRSDAFLLDWTALQEEPNKKRRVAMRRSDGSWRWAQDWAVVTAEQLAGEKVWFDLTGDGVDDAIWRDWANDLWVSPGSGVGQFSYNDPTRVYSDSSRNNRFGNFVNGQVEYFDANADGLIDVVWDPLSAAPAVMLNNGSGDLTTVLGNTIEADLAGVETNKADLSRQDVNADGRLDVVAVLGEAGRKFVWLLNADGTHTRILEGQRDYAPDKPAYAMSGLQALGDAARADVDGDGIEDGVWRDHTNRIWLARGRSATRAWDAQMVSDPASVLGTDGRFVARQAMYRDVNFDGLLDIVWRDTSYSDSTHTWTLGDERWVSMGGNSGSFAEIREISALDYTDSALAKLAKNDLNGDGRADVLLELGGKWRGWIANADGSFVEVRQGALAEIADPMAPEPLAAGATQVQKNAYDTAYKLYSDQRAAAYKRAVGENTSADVDGDGVADAVWRDGYDVLWVTLSSVASSTAIQPQDPGRFDTGLIGDSDAVRAGRFNDDALLVADFNGDGRADLLRIKRQELAAAASTATLRYGYGDGTFGAAVDLGATGLTSTGGQTWTTYLADVTGDGMLDIVRAASDGVIWVAKATGSEVLGLFNTAAASGQQVFANVSGGGLSFSDVNGDGRSDAVWTKYGPDAVTAVDVRVAYGRADGGFDAAIAGSVRDGTALSGDTVYGDFDGDHATDRLYRDANGTAWVTYNYKDTNARSLGFENFAPGGTAQFADLPLSLVDFNGDGRGDALFAASNGQLWLRYGHDGKLFGDWVLNGNAVALPAGVTSMKTFVGDVDGDGLADLLRVEMVDGKATGRAFLYRTTRTADGGLSFALEDTDTRSGVASLEDVDGDGRMDLVRSQTVSVNESTRGGTATIKSLLAGTTKSQDTEVTRRDVRLGIAGGGFSASSFAEMLKNDVWTFGERYIADFNGDGAKDALFWRAEGGTTSN
ncbi:MAG: FG-GAP-like repeat-containing protein, partial [bacterium]